MEDHGRRTSKRARRPPPRLDNGGDEHSVQQVCLAPGKQETELAGHDELEYYTEQGN